MKHLNEQLSTIHIENNQRFTRFPSRKYSSSSKIVGEYKIGGKLGKGSHGHVNKATKIVTNKKYAVKILPYTEQNREQLQNQIQIQNSLHHKNILKIQQVIRQGDRIYIFMEYCSKGDLLGHINQHGKFAEEMAIQIFVKVYSAVLYMHGLGISHRDIKAQNILLDQDMNPKLIDFGLAKRYNKQIPYLTQYVGSLNYTAPEILNKRKYEPQLIDLWSLSVTLYVMLTAKQPFNPQNDKNLTKFNILRYEWEKNQVYLSKQAMELFQLVFVPVRQRIRLNQVQESSLFKKYYKFLYLIESSVILQQKKIENIQINKAQSTTETQNHDLLLNEKKIIKNLNQKNQQLKNNSQKNQQKNEQNLTIFTEEDHMFQSSNIEVIQKDISANKSGVVNLIRILKNKRSNRSVEPHNKQIERQKSRQNFRVRKSIPKRLENSFLEPELLFNNNRN